MHPHVYEHKNVDCAHLIRQLEECHAGGFWPKLTNRCSKIKDSLNKCLGQEFAQQRKANFEKARERRRRVEEAWRRWEQEDETASV
jgi:COX assembly protein 2